MRIKIFQKGFNYSQDGVGNRLVYHLQGCNMSCPWCANPEGIEIGGTLVVNNDFLLDSICPYGAIHQKQIERNICAECKSRECINENRSLGIRLSYEEYDIDMIIDEVKRSAALFYDGGGATLTGGEPTIQFAAVGVLLENLKKAGIHTAIETNATHPELETLFPLIDMLIMDFKHYDHEVHTRVTGVGNAIIKENIAKAFAVHKNVLIRIPVIKGFNDSEEDIRHFAAFFKRHKPADAAFEVLPYHEYGRTKWLQCGMPYRMKDSFIEDTTLSLYKKIFNENNLPVVHT